MSIWSTISVIVCFLNEERFLPEALESVLSQTYTDWELILVDDGSWDHSTAIARYYVRRHTGKIRYLEHAGHTNRGLSASRNVGIEAARGNYIAFLDADDVWLPDKLQDQVSLLDKYPQAAAVYGALCYWKSWQRPLMGNDEICCPEVGRDSIVAPPTLMVECYPLGAAPPPAPSDLLVRREVVQRLGGFEERFGPPNQAYEDQAFLAKLYLHNHVYVAGDCWTKYRLRPESICAGTQARGLYRQVRLFFLRYLREYLNQHGVRSVEVWQAFDTAYRRCRYPLLSRVFDCISRVSPFRDKT